MKVLIFGGHGMAGHMIKDYLQYATDHELWYTVRQKVDESNGISLNVKNESEVKDVLARVKPDVVVNAVGILNNDAAQRPFEAIYVNSLFPHQLARLGHQLGFRLVHISTDCVFSGKRGNYTEYDLTDGETVYAKTKSLGEVVDDVNITIRTSIIGPELKQDGIGLFHWLMNQTGEILGYRQVFWNGVTTLELAKAIAWLMPRSISGLVHLAAPEKISKYVLLKMLQEVFGRDDLIIKPSDHLVSDKSLIQTRSDFSYQVSSYSRMLVELKQWMETQRKRNYPYR
ncbi:dTDP-4-dehydrorhamnose reductase family protein [Lihuaxuella thermophila]|uniref:dTDP-4-dehydrorhamnose reductase n=1 Tax=Lihuaxuella thermophila TaxID=1173111 RepID=A0A1H8DX91_9BACL|nr:SDR family oxidoreductase [Lihuaxuella thermophila]SEN11941.1 dTDP-4-dehydrorhamnose reductase [Lihuaxuella thermophila]